ncbi:MAG: hypothetical protein ABIV93_26120 [Byssovorax sp.]
MIPRQADQLFTEINTLPPRERLRLVERVIHDLTDGGEVEAAAGDPGAIIGLFADEPELMDGSARGQWSLTDDWKKSQTQSQVIVPDDTVVDNTDK